jgi:hypothetical protein
MRTREPIQTRHRPARSADSDVRTRLKLVEAALLAAAMDPETPDHVQQIAMGALFG